MEAKKLRLDSYRTKSTNNYILNLKDSVWLLEQYLGRNKKQKIVDAELEKVKEDIGALILKMFDEGMEV